MIVVPATASLCVKGQAAVRHERPAVAPFIAPARRRARIAVAKAVELVSGSITIVGPPVVDANLLCVGNARFVRAFPFVET